ncbi:hypothetical protein ES702_02823 [subsurface metagenome]
MSEFSDTLKKIANECYKKNNKGKDCMVESSDMIKLHLHCNFCKKLKKVKTNLEDLNLKRYGEMI